MIKEYGTPDADTSVVQHLLSLVDKGEVMYIVHRPRVPVDARPCLLPLSLTVSVVLRNKNVISVRQPAPGQPTRRI